MCSHFWQAFLDSHSAAVDALLSATALWVGLRARSIYAGGRLTSPATPQASTALPSTPEVSG